MNKQILERFEKYAKVSTIDLELKSVTFKKVSLGEKSIFEFVKGQNKYIRKVLRVNDVDKPSVSFNKDNAKGSRAFYRDYPYVMDRHHIGIIPDSEIVDPEYLYFFLDHFMKGQGFGWGDNVATVEAVQNAEIPLPVGDDSINIQKILVNFIKHEQGKYDHKLKTLAEL